MTKSLLLRCLSLAVASVALCASVANAQEEWRDEGPKRHLFGINGTLARPVGEFQNFVNWGGGLSLYGVFNIKDTSPWGIRFDGSIMSYGRESLRRPLSTSIQRVLIDVTTSNLIASVGVGPQVTIGHGRLRPYGFATVGLSYFATVSSASGTSDGEPFASSTNFDDLTASLSGGAGLMLRLSQGKHPVALDMSAQTVYNGRMSYLRKGSLLEAADGSISFIPIRSNANLVSFRLGVAIGV